MMPSLPEPIIMTLQPEWFRTGYYVYVVLIDFKGEFYFYVGMTGDRAHATARSPFYRMAGHFTQGKSTQNQIIKGLEKNIQTPADDALLSQIRFTYFAWPLEPFFKDDPEHHNKRKRTEDVEAALIQILKAEYEDRVFNKQGTKKATSEAAKETAKAIWGQLQSNIY